MDQLRFIKYDVVCLQETKRTKEAHLKWKTGELVILGSRETDRVVGGVGFVLSKEAAALVRDTKIISPRLATITLSTPKGEEILIVNAYAPTSDASIESREEFYEDVTAAVRSSRAFYKFIVGDFNARVGKREEGETLVGPHGYQFRNDQGNRLIEFCVAERLTHMNSHFQKKDDRKWTWKAPNGATLAEIDHILANRPYMVKDVDVVSPFQTGSDHRLVRCRIRLSHKRAKAARHRPSIYGGTLNDELFRSELAKWTPTETASVSDDYASFVTAIVNAANRATMRPPNHQEARISTATRSLLRQRQLVSKDPSRHLEFCLLSKLCREGVRRDIETYRERKLLQQAEARMSIRRKKIELAEARAVLPSLRDEHGFSVTSRPKMEQLVQTFYTRLFTSTNPIEIPRTSQPEEVPPVLQSEVRTAITSMKSGKAPGPDKITVDILKTGDALLHPPLARLFTRCISRGEIPEQWRTSTTVLIFKKGEKDELKNYRPICLLPVIYKVFTKVILNRIRNRLEEEQPIEQAGFRRNYCCADHIQTVASLIETCREYRMPLVLTFIDYEKAFDTVEHGAIIRALKRQGVDDAYTRVLAECYRDTSTTIQLFETAVTVPITKGVRQGDTISPQLFSACLEDIIRELDWDQFGLSIDGRRLNHLRFADDIVLVTRTSEEASTMLSQLSQASNLRGLRVNRSKTQTMRNRHADDDPVTLGGDNITETSEYVYLGRRLTMLSDLNGEISRRARAAWTAFNNIGDVLKKLKNPRLRADLFNAAVLPALCYASETWAGTKAQYNRLRTVHRALERKLMGYTIRRQRAEGVTSDDLRKRSQLVDPICYAKKTKHRWAGHVVRRTDGRWTRAVIEWLPRDVKRPCGRPATRWSDALKETSNNFWAQIDTTTPTNPPRRHRNTNTTNTTGGNPSGGHPHWMASARDRALWRAILGSAP